MMNGSDSWEAVQRVSAACGGSAREKLNVLEMTWLVVASTARTDALTMPGGFPEERARQVAQLRRLADIVEADEPDLETERLFQEGDDLDAWARRVRGLLGPPDSDDA